MKKIIFCLLMLPFLFTNCSSDLDSVAEGDKTEQLDGAYDQDLDSRRIRYECPRKTITNFFELSTELEKIANCRKSDLECDEAQEEIIEQVTIPFTIASFCSSSPLAPCPDCASPLPSSFDQAFQDNIIAQAQSYASTVEMPCARTEITYNFFTDCTGCNCGDYCGGSQITANCSIAVTLTLKCCLNKIPDGAGIGIGQ